MKIRDLLKNFGNKIGIENLSLGDNNEVRLSISGRMIDVFYNTEKNSIYIASELANIIAVENSFVFANLLEINLAFALSGSGTVGFDRRENKLHYINSLRIKGLNDKEFEDFMTTSLHSMDNLTIAVNSPEFVNRSISFSTPEIHDPNTSGASGIRV